MQRAAKTPEEVVKKTFIGLALSAMLLTLSVPTEAQQPKKVPRIGYLAASDAASESARFEGIRLALRARGYTEGQNIATEYRYADGERGRLPELVAELVRLKVDIIVVVGGDPLIRAAKNATKTIPIVMVGSGADPVEAGYVESLAHPGGNVTGITNINRELGGKRLELLKEAVPKVARVAVLYDPVLPAVYNARAYVDAGGLMSYNADSTDSYRRVAYFLDRILKGTKPADLPVEQPTKFELVINLKTAKQIGVTIPPNMLVRADKVIK
jgi:ABC-type uncharacterized transport system substrate-binding protein